jgi:hypothetical protein
MKNYIQHICHICNNSLIVNGVKVFEYTPNAELNDFATACYRFLKLDYPKFFKMDGLSKLGFLAAELLCANMPTISDDKAGIGIILGNKSSSILSDISHQQSIQTANAYFPSPAVFVYTLPNIMLGEISIRHGFSNENTLLISDDFDAQILQKYTDYLLQEQIIENGIGGWVDAAPKNYEVFLYLINAKASSIWGEHSAENLDFLRNLPATLALEIAA